MQQLLGVVTKLGKIQGDHMYGEIRSAQLQMLSLSLTVIRGIFFHTAFLKFIIYFCIVFNFHVIHCGK